MIKRCIVVLVLLGLLATFGLAAEPRQVVLTWEDDPQTTMTVSWRTDRLLREGGWLRVAPVGSDEFQEITTQSYRVPNAGSAWVYTVKLTGLEPGTEYQVVLGNERATAEPFTFRTAPSEPEEVVFLAGGDSRSNRWFRQEINKMAATERPQFIVFAGDLINSALSETDWNEWFDDWHDLVITPEGRRIPIMPAIGNHEVQGAQGQTKEQAPYYYGRFALPGEESYYVLEPVPGLVIITLDSDHTSPVGGAQLEWLEKTLQMYQDSAWIIVQYHVAAWPSVRSFNERVPAQIRSMWIPLFEKYGVDLVIEAHDHAYKRTVPIYQNREDQERGVVYIGDGAWGAPLRPIKDPADYWWLAETADKYHFYRLTLSADLETLTVEPVFYQDPLAVLGQETRLEWAAITGVNRTRLTDDLILYTPEHGEITGSNVWGHEIAVANGVVVAIREQGDEKPLAIPKNGFVLSGHGVGRNIIRPFAVGQEVHIDVEKNAVLSRADSLIWVDENPELFELFSSVADFVADSAKRRVPQWEVEKALATNFPNLDPLLQVAVIKAYVDGGANTILPLLVGTKRALEEAGESSVEGPYGTGFTLYRR